MFTMIKAAVKKVVDFCGKRTLKEAALVGAFYWSFDKISGKVTQVYLTVRQKLISAALELKEEIKGEEQKVIEFKEKKDKKDK